MTPSDMVRSQTKTMLNVSYGKFPAHNLHPLGDFPEIMRRCFGIAVDWRAWTRRTCPDDVQ